MNAGDGKLDAVGAADTTDRKVRGRSGGGGGGSVTDTLQEESGTI